MRYELTRGNPSYWGKDPPYQVERVLEKDMRYLVACFNARKDAAELMKVLEKSVEVERGGGLVHAA